MNWIILWYAKLVSEISWQSGRQQTTFNFFFKHLVRWNWIFLCGLSKILISKNTCKISCKSKHIPLSSATRSNSWLLKRKIYTSNFILNPILLPKFICKVSSCWVMLKKLFLRQSMNADWVVFIQSPMIPFRGKSDVLYVLRMSVRDMLSNHASSHVFVTVKWFYFIRTRTTAEHCHWDRGQFWQTTFSLFPLKIFINLKIHEIFKNSWNC